MKNGQGNGLRDAVKRLGQAVPKMKELGVAPTPANFTLWYEYFGGQHLELKREFDRLLEVGREFTPELNADLYQRFFGEGSEAQLKEIREAIRHLINQLSEQLTDLVDDMNGYDAVLADCESQLEAGADIDTLRILVSRLLKETRQARDTSQATSQLVTELNGEIEVMRRAMDELNEEVLVDSLTGIANRRSFDQKLRELLSASSFNGRKCCLLMLDIDRFKQFNDEHGHLVGDRVLRFVAEMIKKGIKGRDFVARYGGEEFAVILPNTEYGGGMAVSRAIADTVANRQLIVGTNKRSLGNVTLSVGLSIYRQGDTSETLIERADACLYRAKELGRNGVVGEKS